MTVLNVEGGHDFALCKTPGLEISQARKGLASDTVRLPVTGMRTGLAAEADRSFEVVDLYKCRGARHRPSGGRLEAFGLGQLMNQRFAGFFGWHVGLAFFEPLQLAVPGGEFGGR